MQIDRRTLLSGAGLAAAAALGPAVAADLPPVTNPRATDGDERFEPNWDERFTLTVGAKDVIKRTLVARSGSRFKLNEGLRSNVWLSGSPTCASLFPLLSSERSHDVWIENLALDGSRANCENFNGNYGGCVFILDCSR